MKKIFHQNFIKTSRNFNKFHENIIPILMNDIDINKIVVYNKLRFCKQGFIYFIACKDDKKLNRYANSFQKGVQIESVLMKMNVCISC